MNQPPSSLDGAKVLYYIYISGNYKKSEKFKHHINGRLLAEVPALAICRYENDSEVYIFHCRENWDVMTDDLLDSIESAFEQTSIQYEGISKANWVKFI